MNAHEGSMMAMPCLQKGNVGSSLTTVPQGKKISRIRRTNHSVGPLCNFYLS